MKITITAEDLKEIVREKIAKRLNTDIERVGNPRFRSAKADRKEIHAEIEIYEPEA